MKIKLDSAQKERFNKLSFHNKKKDTEGTYPDFMILGPQRTGTTWLSDNMRLHPEIYLSIPKELYFFSRLDKGSKRSLHFDNFVNKISGKKSVGRGNFARDFMKIAYFDFIITGNYKATELEWYLKFFDLNTPLAKKHAKEMVEKYGQPYTPKVLGESTASYAAMDEELIEEAVALNPDLKAIIMVRNPVQRAWSHSKKALSRDPGKKLGEVDLQSFKDFLSRDYLVKCGHYSKQIATWNKYLKEGNLFIGHFDDVSQRPVELLMNVFEFLGVDQNRDFISPDVDKVINPAGKGSIPTEIENFLYDLFEEEMIWMKEELGLDYLKARA